MQKNGLFFNLAGKQNQFGFCQNIPGTRHKRNFLLFLLFSDNLFSIRERRADSYFDHVKEVMPPPLALYPA